MTAPVFPIIVLRSYVQSGAWPGHHVLLNHPELAVTWVELTSDDAMLYVNKDRHKVLESQYGDLHEYALNTLREHSEDLATHVKEKDGRPILMAMMHADGLGSSRLLLVPELQVLFPGGFKLAIPDRSCGLLMPPGLNSEEIAEFTSMVGEFHADATAPLLPGVCEPHDFEIADR
jgi:hypothetical protein